MSNVEGEEIGSFGYGFKLIRLNDGRLEFQPTTIIKNVPVEFIIMQMQVFLDDMKKEYNKKHGRKQSEDE